MGPCYGVIGGAMIANESRESTMLELHLDQLVRLRGILVETLERSRRCADRLLGAEPPQLARGDGASPADLPLCRKIEMAGDDLYQLADLLHQQVLRLERL